ncbi:MAG TPA: hypothetical protein P5136_06350 [Methanofastidiosum sp.]|nr:hypothetical protein [Methanofastidiosum sp.]
MQDFTRFNTIDDILKTAKEDSDKTLDDLKGLLSDLSEKFFEIAYLVQNWKK